RAEVALQVIQGTQLRHDVGRERRAELGLQRLERDRIPRIDHRDRDRAGRFPAPQRDRAEPVRIVGAELLEQQLVRLVEERRRRDRQAGELGEIAAQRFQIEKAQLDEVRAETAAIEYLVAQRRLELREPDGRIAQEQR